MRRGGGEGQEEWRMKRIRCVCERERERAMVCGETSG